MIAKIARRILNAAAHPLNYSRWAEVFQVFFVGMLVYFYRATPPPGYSVAWLAAAGVVMAVRADRFTTTEKVVWIIVAAAFVIFEIRAIDRDRQDHDKQEAEIRETDTILRGVEIRSFQRLLNQGAQLFSQEQRLSRRTINTITGGDTYPSVVAVEIPNRGGWTLTLIANGKNNLISTYVSVLSHAQLGATNPQAYLRQMNSRTGQMVPMVLAGHSVELSARIEPEGDLDVYQIDMASANRAVTEMLTMKKVSGVWIEERSITDEQGHLLESVPKKPKK